MRTVYCRLKNFGAYGELRRLTGMTVFIAGPHDENSLNLNTRNDFGHYNPEFVRRLPELILPAVHDPAFRRLSQPVYNQYLKDLARIHFLTYVKLRNNPDFAVAETEHYRQLTLSGEMPEYHYEKYFFFMNPKFVANAEKGFSFFYKNGFDGGFNGNVVKTVTAFWIRRRIDNTAGDFFEGLKLLLQTYDAGFLQEATDAASER